MNGWTLALAFSALVFAGCSNGVVEDGPKPYAATESGDDDDDNTTKSVTKAKTSVTSGSSSSESPCLDHPPFPEYPVQSLSYVPISDQPAGEGGTIPDGTYLETEIEWIDPRGGSVIKSWLRIAGKSIVWDYEGQCYTGTFTTSENQITWNINADTVNFVGNNFTATPTTLTVIQGDVQIYTKQ